MEQRRHTLLVVDDEVDVLESLRHQFHRDVPGAHVVLGTRRRSRFWSRDDVELILTDQRMPGMSGDQFLRQARQLKPDAIRMLFTGYADIQAVISAVNEGHIFRYILKPWDYAPSSRGSSARVSSNTTCWPSGSAWSPSCRRPTPELLQANEELARAGQFKTAFIEVASHEFNTPITLVLGLTELLRLCNPHRSDQEQEILRQITAQRQATGSAGHEHADLASRRGFPQDPASAARSTWPT